ncbi:hypothetical protein J5J01_05540 [Streptomyces fradiae]|uniref:hypothetical protein n=1 Tax=Streptomyces fradiae TaxID=1906 RepID=UPI0020187144|nr:hypothetical protein [Streptomyces fradiae]UQS31156.1 hypothetical protein J5J01_05540 [Streptomyces fradiae]
MAVDLSFSTSPLSEEIRAQGEAGRAAEDILTVLEQRGILVPEAVRGRITRRMDPHVMRDWFRRAFAVAVAGQVFGDE